MAEEPPLEARRAEITTRLEALRIAPEISALVRQANQAVTAFKGETAQLEGQIAEIDAQIGARARHEREQAARQRQDHVAVQRRLLVDMAEERREAVAAAEAGARQLAAAFGRTLDVTARMARLTHELSGGQSTPGALNEYDLTSRLSIRLSALMVTIPRCRARFGGIQWPASSLYPPADSWSAAEEKLVAAALQPVLERGPK